MLTKEQQIARVFKAIGDENRVLILQKLQQGETCACWLLKELNISQPKLSHHMRILVDAGIVDCRRSGKWMHYAISEEGSRQVTALLSELLFTRKDAEGTRCCNEEHQE